MPRVEAIPAFQDNYIWLLRRPGGNEAALVDPGDAEPVLRLLKQQGLKPVALLITHKHYDHTGGIGELVKHYPMPVYGPAEENIRGVDHALREGDQVKLPELEMSFQVLEVFGHTCGHIAYQGHGLLFPGDTLFTGGCGRLFEGSPEQMQASLAKIAGLPDETLVYCAHEYTQENLRFAERVEPDSPALRARIADTERARRAGEATVPAPLSLEKQTNPFLRWAVPEVARAAEQFAGRRLESPAEIFASLRRWKDSLD